jgi:cytosolic nonspecific dipeptidase
MSDSRKDSNDDAVSSTSVSPPPTWMNDLFTYIEEHQSIYIDRLREAVAIPSVSSNLVQHLSDIENMMQWTAIQHIERLGGTYELRTNPRNTEAQRLPPILLASFPGIGGGGGADDKNGLKTVCVYGHLDVQPASIEDGWDTDPFVLTEKDEKLYGRGSTDDKGPALSWLWIIEAYQALHIPLPVNIKIIYEYVGWICLLCVSTLASV